ncbi:MAG: prepilin-type N-terminal cleavage/methylation domain-containing protein [Candidatus Omnitrophica bacterium]|nr:prepilin-type N-terminal cleavage/methylation domain-containing protein [Candidatus Omnitrophota bacterium]
MRCDLKGFTLIELLVVVVIIGILSSIAVPMLRGVVIKAKLTDMYTTMIALKTAQEKYYIDSGKYFVATGWTNPATGDIVTAEIKNNLGVDVYANANLEFTYYLTSATEGWIYGAKWNAGNIRGLCHYIAMYKKWYKTWSPDEWQAYLPMKCES